MWDNKIFGLVAPGYAMAKTAISHLTGADKTFKGADMSTKLKLLGVEVASIGDAQGNTVDSQSYSFIDSATGIYKKIVMDESGKILLGAVLVGDSSDYGQWLQLALNKIEINHPPEISVTARNGWANSRGKYPGWMPSPITHKYALAWTSLKNNFAKPSPLGAADINALKSCTSAGTGCGGCVPLLTQVMNAQLSKQGVSIDNSLCRHFKYSRTQLFDIIRVKEIRSFNALLDDCGAGDGCEICKPAVASMLASLWNEHVLEAELLSLQDTNDNFLGNMQKNGTYSIVATHTRWRANSRALNTDRTSGQRVQLIYKNYRRATD